MPRKSLLTDERKKKMLDSIRTGGYIEPATRLAGISTSTYFNWKRRGQAERERLAADRHAKPDPVETPYLAFLEEIEQAEAEAEVRLTAIIANAAPATWQAAAWLLERKNPRRWGRFDRQEITGHEGGPIKIDVSTEQLEAKVEQALAKRGGKKA